MTESDTTTTDVASEGKPTRVRVNIWTVGSRTDVDIYVYSLIGDPKIISISSGEFDQKVKTDNNLDQTTIRGTFTLPGSEELDTYRRRSAQWSPNGQSTLINHIELRKCLIKNHLKKLMIVETQEDFGLKLNKDETRLMDESVTLLQQKLHPTIIETLVAKFVSENDLFI